MFVIFLINLTPNLVCLVYVFQDHVLADFKYSVIAKHLHSTSAIWIQGWLINISQDTEVAYGVAMHGYSRCILCLS